MESFDSSLNKMKRCLYRRFWRRFFVVFGASSFLLLSIVIAKPVFAADLILNERPDSFNQSTATSGTGGNNWYADRWTVTGSHLWNVEQVTVSLKRDAFADSGCKVGVLIYGGEDTISGSLLIGRSDEVDYGSVSTGDGQDITFTFSTVVGIFPGLKVHFAPYYQGSACLHFLYYQFQSGSSGPPTNRVAKRSSPGSVWDIPVGLARLAVYAVDRGVFAFGDEVIDEIAPVYTNEIYVNGGGSSNFASGTGALFQSNKNVYSVNEQVQLRWIFNSPFSVSRVKIYKNGSGSALLQTLSGSADLVKNVSHTGIIQYTNTGSYQPMLRVESATGTPHEDIYLGGEHTSHPLNAIVVIGPVSIPGIIEVQTGTIVGQFSGATNPSSGTGQYIFSTNTSSGIGIFGITEMYGFTGFGRTGNTFLDGAQSLLLVVVNAVIWVSQRLYFLLRFSAAFTFVDSIIHPASGACYTTATTLFAHSIPSGLQSKAFCIAYNTHKNSSQVTYLLQLVFVMGIFSWAVSHFIFRHKKHV